MHEVSLLGYGCMRLPTTSNSSARDCQDEIDQDMVNRQVDDAIAHGVNYFDTSPAYCKGRSEHAMRIALSSHPRDKYFIATKLSNFSPDTWSQEASIAMYRNSLKELQVDYLDYMLLHGIGMGGMEAMKGRYLDNGMLDFLIGKRKAGRIRNLGFSYHGDIEVFIFSFHSYSILNMRQSLQFKRQKSPIIILKQQDLKDTENNKTKKYPQSLYL